MTGAGRRRPHARTQRGSPAAIDRRERALSLFRAGRLDEAEVVSRRILDRAPQDPSALHTLAMIEARRGRHHQAIALFRMVTALCPAYGDAHRNLGSCLLSVADYRSAVDCFRRALQLNPADIDSMNNLANALLALGDFAESIALFGRAIALAPDNPALHYNLANTLSLTKDYQGALAHYEETLARLPDFQPAACRVVHAQLQTCRWRHLAERNDTANRLLRSVAAQGASPREEPHANISRCDDPAINRLVAEAVGTTIAAGAAAHKIRFTEPSPAVRPERITIGYVSGNFRTHPNVFLLLGVLARHDRRRFRINLYSATPADGGGWRQRLQEHCDRFVDIFGMPGPQAARIIFADGVDILVDLDGYSSGNRLDVAALRPAPVIVTYLGFPGTTGAPFIDYLIADRVVLPEGDTRFYTEQIVYMPHQYLATDGTPEIAPSTSDRRHFGLGERGIVFCSFNQAYKIEPSMFATWMRILQRVPGSVLWLWRSNPWMAANLSAEASGHGVDPEHRLVFAETLPRPKHLARLRLADIGLDTRIYNGHTTTQDALSVGVPVIALRGRHFASRVSSSLLIALGLDELVTDRLEDYAALAVALGNDSGRIAALKAKLEANRQTQPLFDAARYVRNLESAYARMLQIHRAGERPRRIDVSETDD